MAIIKNARVAFIADDKRYRAGLKRVEQDTQKAIDRLQSLGQKATRAILASVGAQAGLIKFYRDQEQAEIAVAAAIKQVGRESEISLDYVKAYSGELQKSSIFGDEAAIAASTLGIRLADLNKEQLPRFVRLVADYATTMGRALPRSARMLATYLADPLQGMSRLAQAGITLNETTKDYIRTLVASGKNVEAQGVLMDELEKKFSGASQAALNGTGIIIAAKNAWGDFAEKIGEVIFKSIQPFVVKAKELAESLQENEVVIRRVAKALQFLLIFGVVTKAAVLLTIGLRKLVFWFAKFGGAALAQSGAVKKAFGVISAAAAAMLAFMADIPSAFRDAKEWVDDFFTSFNLAMLEFNVKLKGLTNDIVSSLNDWGLASDELAEKTESNFKRAIQAEREAREVASAPIPDELYEAFARKGEEMKRESSLRQAGILKQGQEQEQKDLAESEGKKEEIRVSAKEKENARKEADAAFAIEQEKLATEYENEALRQRLQGLDEIDIEHYEGKKEIELARREAERVEDEERRELELENLRLQEERLDQLRAENYAKRKETEVKEFKAAEKKQQMQYRSAQKAALGHLKTLFGQYEGISKAIFVAQKAVEIAELIQATESNAAQAYTNAMAQYPYPVNVGIAQKVYTMTKVAGYLGVAAAAATAIQGATGKIQGGLIHGNPALGDAYPHLLQAGEAVVPRSNYDDLVRGVRARIANEDDGDFEGDSFRESREVNVNIEMLGEAGNLFRATLDGNRVLGV